MHLHYYIKQNTFVRSEGCCKALWGVFEFASECADADGAEDARDVMFAGGDFHIAVENTLRHGVRRGVVVAVICDGGGD